MRNWCMKRLFAQEQIANKYKHTFELKQSKCQSKWFPPLTTVHTISIYYII